MRGPAAGVAAVVMRCVPGPNTEEIRGRHLSLADTVSRRRSALSTAGRGSVSRGAPKAARARSAERAPSPAATLSARCSTCARA